MAMAGEGDVAREEALKGAPMEAEWVGADGRGEDTASGELRDWRKTNGGNATVDRDAGDGGDVVTPKPGQANRQSKKGKRRSER
jgi:hypothetical protein